MLALDQILKPVDQQVYEQFKDYLNLTRDLLLFSDRVIDELNEARLIPEDESAFRRFLLYLFFKSTSHGVSLWLVASIGHKVESFILARPVVEALIQLRYIQQHGASDMESLSEEFFAYLRFRQRKGIHHALSIANERGDLDSIQVFSGELKNLNLKYHDKKYNDFWLGQKMDELAKKAGMGDYYKTVFDLFSKYVHSSQFTLYEFYDPVHNCWSARPKLEDLDMPLHAFFEAYVNIVDALSQEFWGKQFRAMQTFRNKLDTMKQASEKSRRH